MTCTELVREDVLEIIAIPLGNITPGTQSWQLNPTIDSNRFSPSMAGAITVGLKPVTPIGRLIPIVRETGKAKDSEADSVAGRLHTVNVSCDVDDREHEVWDFLYALERTESHLILVFRDRSRAFVQATSDTYLCEVERSGGKTTVTFRIQNLMGIQLIV